jgi:uncharacterized protein (DUF1501 family)
MSLSRRNFLLSLGGGVLVQSLPGFTRVAQAAGDYKALVCVFLFGGNDGHNTLVPLEATAYAEYLAARGDSTLSGNALGLSRSSLTAITAPDGQQYGLHPSMAPLAPYWSAGQLAALFNVGTLVQPMTKAEYQAHARPRPDKLFSHSDQQAQWQSMQVLGEPRTGWGGRVVDVIGSGAGGSVPMATSLSGDVLFFQGHDSRGLAIPVTASFKRNSFGGNYASAVNNAYAALLAQSSGHPLIAAAQDITTDALATSAVLDPIITAAASVDTPFANLSTGIANQLRRVARIIARRGDIGASRQIFFVGLGGFDTHVGQIGAQAAMLKQLADALKAFHDAMAQIGTASMVTSFTQSDFGRTLKPNATGSDHGWGNHQFIIGGAVNGGRFYGQFPKLVLGGPDDIANEGRLLPTTAVDQYAATLAKWFGVPDASMATVLPNLAKFAVSDLGFMK